MLILKQNIDPEAVTFVVMLVVYFIATISPTGWNSPNQSESFDQVEIRENRSGKWVTIISLLIQCIIFSVVFFRGWADRIYVTGYGLAMFIVICLIFLSGIVYNLLSFHRHTTTGMYFLQNYIQPDELKSDLQDEHFEDAPLFGAKIQLSENFIKVGSDVVPIDFVYYIMPFCERPRGDDPADYGYKIRLLDGSVHRIGSDLYHYDLVQLRRILQCPIYFETSSASFLGPIRLHLRFRHFLKQNGMREIARFKADILQNHSSYIDYPNEQLENECLYYMYIRINALTI